MEKGEGKKEKMGNFWVIIRSAYVSRGKNVFQMIEMHNIYPWATFYLKEFTVDNIMILPDRSKYKDF